MTNYHKVSSVTGIAVAFDILFYTTKLFHAQDYKIATTP